MTTTISIDPIANEIRKAHELARQNADSAVQSAIRAGELLAQKKATLDHGQWLPWVEANCGFTRQTAANYIRLAEKANGKHVLHLTVRDALDVLAEPKPARRCKCGVRLEANSKHSQCLFCRGEVKLAATSEDKKAARLTPEPNLPITDRDDPEPSTPRPLAAPVTQSGEDDDPEDSQAVRDFRAADAILTETRKELMRLYRNAGDQPMVSVAHTWKAVAKAADELPPYAMPKLWALLKNLVEMTQ